MTDRKKHVSARRRLEGSADFSHMCKHAFGLLYEFVCVCVCVCVCVRVSGWFLLYFEIIR